MSKKPMTWLELIKLKLSEEKAKGKSPSIGDVTPLAKKEWVQIKEGKHPLYMQGKAQTFARKKKGASASKTKKNSKSSSPKSSSPKSSSPKSASAEQILAEAKLCTKCKKKVEKVMKKKGMKGGQCMAVPQAPVINGGNCGGSCGMTGGCLGCVM
jgi:hypothetical protein